MTESFQIPPYLGFDVATRRVQLDPHEPRFVQDPYAAYAFLHRQACVFFWEEYGYWCFSGYEDVNRLLRDRRFGREKPASQSNGRQPAGDRSHLANFDSVEAHSLLELEPPKHTRLRALVNRAFVSRQVERLRPRIEEIANQLIDDFAGTGSVDLMPAYATPLPIALITELLGVPAEMAPKLLSWSHAMVKMYVLGPTREDEEAADQAGREFSEFLRAYVHQRRESPGDDLLSLLISATEDGERLSEDELVSSVILLLNAGHEATVHQTGNAVRTLLKQDGAPGRFLTTPQETASSIEECLRIDAPLHMFTRYAYETVNINDVTIHAGDEIGLLLGAANCDPEAFIKPRTFLPDRPDQKNVSFGAGLHFCIGAPLARIELQVSLKTLFDRLPTLKLAEPPRYRDDYHFHGLERLLVTW